MKVTIITDGTTRIVLTPKTPAEILAVKELHSKDIIATHHESTQILSESSPNCLVLGANPEEPKVSNGKKTRMVIIDERDASVVATFDQEKDINISRIAEIIAMECNFEDWEEEQTAKDVLTIRDRQGKGELNFLLIKVNDY